MLFAALVIAIISPLLGAIGIRSESVAQLVVGITVTIGVGYWGGRLLARKPVHGSSHRRGAVVTDGIEAAELGGSVTLGGIPIRLEDETKHFKFIGTTGTGKSTAIRELLSAGLARGDRAVIADPDGGYLRNFYDADRGDVILNPFDPDSLKWSLFGEIQNDYDVEQLAHSLIPENGASDRTWIGYARTFFSAVVHQSLMGDFRDDKEIFRLLTFAPVKELKSMLHGTAAGPFLETGNEKMFGSVRSITTSAVAALEYTCRQQAPLFSVREWVRMGAAREAGGQGGVLFIPYKAGEIAALRSVISAWMRLAIFEAMNRDDADQRLWFIVDELDALGEIDGLKDALARLRKFGGRCVLGFQSIAQVSGTYGKAAADTIVENCGNTLILRCSASEQGGTSQFASRLIGQREVMHTTRSQTRRSTEWLGSTTTSQHIGIEPAVMASEIERLADLEGYLKIASGADWIRVKLRTVPYPAKGRGRRQGRTTEVQSSSDTPPDTGSSAQGASQAEGGSDTSRTSATRAESIATTSVSTDRPQAASAKPVAKRKRNSPARASKPGKAEGDAAPDTTNAARQAKGEGSP
jgi:type IV secretory pathway TraG/TraD family ATPase VirD4